MIRENLLEEEIATHSNIFAWKIPWTNKHAGGTVHGVTKSLTRLSTRAPIKRPKNVNVSSNYVFVP